MAALLKASEDLRPLTDLKVHAGDIVRQLADTGRPVILTRHGRGVAVMLSLELFEDMQEQLEQPAVLRGLQEAVDDQQAGRVLEHEEIVAKYVRKR